ncbi:hypothetical protein NKH18_47285 [Streptomyces sp. M10(2022)]
MPGGNLENTISRHGVNTTTLPPSVLERTDPAFLAQLEILIVGARLRIPSPGAHGPRVSG